MAIEIYKNNHRKITYTVVDQDLNPIDLTDATIDFFVKLTYGDKETIIKKTSSDGSEIEKDDSDSNKCHIYITPNDTEELTTKKYLYELRIILSNGNKYTAAIGEFIVKDTVITFKDDN